MVGDVAVGHGVQHVAGDLRPLVRHLVRVDQRRARRHRRHHVEHSGQLLVVDGDPLDRLLGGILVLRRDSRHHLARVAHAVDGERGLVLLEEAVAAGAVLPGDDGAHARHLCRGRYLEVRDARVRDTGAQCLAHQHAAEADVDTVHGAAAHLGHRIGSHHRLADHDRLGHAVSDPRYARLTAVCSTTRIAIPAVFIVRMPSKRPSGIIAASPARSSARSARANSR